jgi:hypothetical protein
MLVLSEAKSGECPIFAAISDIGGRDFLQDKSEPE